MAANRLKITQPTVSRQIKLLEAELGVPLFERSSREVKPTVQGQLFFDYAQKILNLVQRAESAVQSISSHLEGRLRMATINYLGISFIAPVLGLFLKPHRQFKIQLSYAPPYEIIEKMKNSEMEVVILPHLKKEYGVSFPHYEKRSLFQDQMLFVGSRRDISLPRSISVQNFGERPFVSFSNILPQFNLYLEQKKREHGVQVDSIFEVNNLGTMKKIIETNMYWGFMPKSSIQKQVRSGRLSVVKVVDMEYTMGVDIYFLKKLENQKIIEILFLLLKKQAVMSQLTL